MIFKNLNHKDNWEWGLPIKRGRVLTCFAENRKSLVFAPVFSEIRSNLTAGTISYTIYKKCITSFFSIILQQFYWKDSNTKNKSKRSISPYKAKVTSFGAYCTVPISASLPRSCASNLSIQIYVQIARNYFQRFPNLSFLHLTHRGRNRKKASFIKQHTGTT
jgi:hypothetical protein